MRILVTLSLLLLVCFPPPLHAAFADGDGRKTVTTAGTSEALSSTLTMYREVTICAETDNTGVITVGTSPVAALATREGVPLQAADCYTEVKRGSLSAILIDTTVNGDGVTFRHVG